MALLDDVRKVAGVADRLKGPVGNEANTKALLVEPMLSALGWDTTNLDHVLRDWPVRQDSSVDYALRIGEDNVMFVEARGVNESVDDDAFAAKAIAGAHSEGVLWCVVTNGLVYRVYRTDEEVATNDKLSFEVDLTKAAVGSPADTASVPLLSRASVSDGSLALWGEQKVFTDPRVRVVLAQLAAKPSAAFLDAINEAIGERKVPRDRLRASLSRVLVVETAGKATPTTSMQEPPFKPRDTPAVPVGIEPAAGPAARLSPPPIAPSTPPAPVVAAPEPEARHEPETPPALEAQHAPGSVPADETPDAAASPETAAKRRFLGGPRGPREGGHAAESGHAAEGGQAAEGIDPYAPLSKLEDPFADT
jgi:hypothetical protein